MRLVGHGIDIVELNAIKKLLDHSEEDFLTECFTEEERVNAPSGPHRLAHLTGQFAGKEAVLKALGSGFGEGVAFTDVEIRRSASGAPTVRLSGGAAHVAAELQADAWLISISHGELFAVASAIAIGADHSHSFPR